MFDAFKATKRLKQLEEAVEEQSRIIRSLRLEWNEAFERLNVLMARMAKRARQVEAESPPDGVAVPDAVAPSLSERAAQINAQILARRNRSQRGAQ